MIKIGIIDDIFHKSNAGSQPKWKIDNIWYKKDDFNHEGLAETIVSELLKKSNVKDYAIYEPELIAYKGVVSSGCKSRNFLSDDAELVESTELLNMYGMDDAAKDEYESIQDPEASVKEFVSTMKDITGLDQFDVYLAKMFEPDMITLNSDWHFGTIIMLKHPSNYDYAPFFDQERALALRDDLWDCKKSVEEIIESVETRPFSGIFSKQTKILEEISGGKYFRTSYGMDDLRNTLDKCAFVYPDKILRRAEEVFTVQMQKNIDYFVGKEKAEILRDYKEEIERRLGLSSDIAYGCLQINI